MRLIFHGTLRDKFGESFNMNGAKDIREAVEGFSRQNADWPKDLLIDIVGYPNPANFDQCPDEIDLMPAILGGGGNFGKILIGAALIAAAIAIPGSTAFLAALNTALISAGTAMILQGVMGLFMKAPVISKSNDPDASKYIGNGKNTTEADTPIIMAWGTIDILPHWLSLQSDSSNLTQGVFPANPT